VGDPYVIEMVGTVVWVVIVGAAVVAGATVEVVVVGGTDVVGTVEVEAGRITTVGVVEGCDDDVTMRATRTAVAPRINATMTMTQLRSESFAITFSLPLQLARRGI
jgi:hypothetical protein